MMQARKIKYDVIGLTETRRHRRLHAGEELFLGTRDSRGVGGKVWPNPSSNHLRCLRTNIEYEEELEAFYMDLERLYREDHTFFKVIVGDFNAKIGPRRTAEELHIGTYGMEWNEQGERLSEFIMSTHTIHGNSQFQKPSHLRWTWESPGGQFHNEIDHIIFNRRKRSPKTINWDHFASIANEWEDSVIDNIEKNTTGSPNIFTIALEKLRVQK
uniref:Endo/exonuclease/phosphatase domain-containing protein n=1 Tax=Haemonchus contortus TaxID=6289 RepID=A0A7I4Z0E9_HAECO